MTYDCIIGIDPGANGGIAVWTQNHVSVVRMPRDMSELRRLVQYYQDNYNVIVFIEKINIRHDDLMTDGGRANMGKIFRIQQMVRNHEALKATIAVCDIPYCEVHPLTWQSRLHLRGFKDEAKSDRKRRYKVEAQKYFPQVNVTMWNCDALHIMRFGRYVLEWEIKWLNKNILNLPKNKLL